MVKEERLERNNNTKKKTGKPVFTNHKHVKSAVVFYKKITSIQQYLFAFYFYWRNVIR